MRIGKGDAGRSVRGLRAVPQRRGGLRSETEAGESRPPAGRAVPLCRGLGPRRRCGGNGDAGGGFASFSAGMCRGERCGRLSCGCNRRCAAGRRGAGAAVHSGLGRDGRHNPVRQPVGPDRNSAPRPASKRAGRGGEAGAGAELSCPNRSRAEGGACGRCDTRRGGEADAGVRRPVCPSYRKSITS